MGSYQTSLSYFGATALEAGKTASGDTALILGAAGTAAVTGASAWAALAAGANVVPVVGQVAAGVIAVGVSLYKLAQGCGETCTVASKYADQAQVLLGQNLEAFRAANPKYESVQRIALDNFDRTAEALYKACSQSGLGDAGKRCIAERLVRGGPAPWCPTPDHTGCDWITAYRDPIANTPTVPDPIIQGAVIGKVPEQLKETFSKQVDIGGQKISVGALALAGLALVLIVRSAGR